MKTEQELTPLEKISQLRDELRLQMHLGGSELKAQWEELEVKWRQLLARLQPVKRVGAESARDVGTAAQMLMKELADGYARVRQALKEL